MKGNLKEIHQSKRFSRNIFVKSFRYFEGVFQIVRFLWSRSKYYVSFWGLVWLLFINKTTCAKIVEPLDQTARSTGCHHFVFIGNFGTS